MQKVSHSVKMALSSFVLSHVSGCGWVVPAFGIELATNKIQFLGVGWNIVREAHQTLSQTLFRANLYLSLMYSFRIINCCNKDDFEYLETEDGKTICTVYTIYVQKNKQTCKVLTSLIKCSSVA